MAIKNRIIGILNNAIKNNQTNNFSSALEDLNIAQEWCQKGLSDKNYAVYKEVYDGIALALQNLVETGFEQELVNLVFEFLNYLKIQTKNETHFKKEIVFLPIQASMWDSLESVWQAAANDADNCIAYVMPLPYSGLNRDDTVDKWYCERDKFPKYVPTLDYRYVDLKEMHPDILVYNNPYDDANLITRVKEEYFSSNLKKCADKLVYIPYFILTEPFNKEEVEHFVLNSGVLNADLIIVQSEELKQYYIDILINKTPLKERAVMEQHELKKRILALGSPKTDKILSAKRDDFDLPYEWKKIIEGKKVILYLTSFGAQINNAEKMLDKMRFVFDTFKKRKDVVLWWRPHPLLKQSIHALLPILDEGYAALEEEYIKEGFGIYDDSGDLNRAICCSDAYYGDNSSVVKLYKYTGKPIMIENFDIIN